MDKCCFQNPPSSYRGKPFWAWNGDLKEELLLWQIDVMRQMGMGGFFCHSRTGLVTEYLGDTWFQRINACADDADAKGLETWLYDEDRWPSGTAGGMVTQGPSYRARYIRMSILHHDAYQPDADALCAFEVELEGYRFTGKRRLTGTERPARPYVLKFTLEEMEPHAFYNGSTYVDTMDPKATQDFIRRTHARYAEECGERLGTTIRGIFTDEPHRGAVMNGFGLSNPQPEFLTPYTGILLEEFRRRFDADLLEMLPELFLFPDGQKIHPVKWQYMELLQQLFLDHFLRPIQTWCASKNLLLTGHVLHEDTLTSQGSMIGSVMRAYEYMDHPGVDVLTEQNRSYWIVLQLRSVGRQMGKHHLLSELYGCTGWQFGFKEHKTVGDWQALLGINQRCHHLSWYTMKGEAKRDYPASIFYQSAWFQEYKAIEDYYARLHVFLEEGEALCDVLMIHPVESTWAVVHPGWSMSLSTNDPDVQRIETCYFTLCNNLLSARIDLDIGDEDHLSRFGRIIPAQVGEDLSGSVDSEPSGVTLLELGQMRYRCLLVPEMLTMRGTTCRLVEEFASAGGKVVFVHRRPDHIDCRPDDRLQKIPAQDATCENIAHELDVDRFVLIDEAPQIFCQTRRVADGYHVVLMNVSTEISYKGVCVVFGKSGRIERWDVRTGQVTLLREFADAAVLEFPPLQEYCLRICVDRTVPSTMGTEQKDTDREASKEGTRSTEFEQREDGQMEDCPRESNQGELIHPEKQQQEDFREHAHTWNRIPDDGNQTLDRSFHYRMSEPNVLVLDLAEYSVDGESMPLTEILTIDQHLRDRFGLPHRGGDMLQPWFRGAQSGYPLSTLVLTYQFELNAFPDRITMAMESPEDFVIWINGVEVQKATRPPVRRYSSGTPDTSEPGTLSGTSTSTGNSRQSTSIPCDWADPCFTLFDIDTAALRMGHNTITLTTEYRADSNLEAIYLLGDFGVSLDGRNATITALPETITTGDLTVQGFPFYGAEIVYQLNDIPNHVSRLLVTEARAACLKIRCSDRPSDGRVLIAPPYSIDLGSIQRMGTLEISCILTRRNTFGPLHYTPLHAPAYGPELFTDRDPAHYCDQYCLLPQGITGDIILFP
jgi:hypothetical protein